MLWGDEPVLFIPPMPKESLSPVQKGELHWGRALGQERRVPGAEQGCAQLWGLMCWWIPSPVSAPLSEPQAGSGSPPGAALSALVTGIHLSLPG